MVLLVQKQQHIRSATLITDGGGKLRKTLTPYNPPENIKSLKTNPIVPEGHMKAALQTEKDKCAASLEKKKNLHSSTPHSESHQSGNSVPLLRASIWGNSLNPLLQLLSSNTHRVKNSFLVATI